MYYVYYVNFTRLFKYFSIRFHPKTLHFINIVKVEDMVYIKSSYIMNFQYSTLLYES